MLLLVEKNIPMSNFIIKLNDIAPVLKIKTGMLY